MSTLTANNLQQEAAVLEAEKVLAQDTSAKQGAWGSDNWQQETLAKGRWDSTGLMREQLYYAAQLPQGQQAVSVPPPIPVTKQTLPVTIHGFSQRAGLSGFQESPVMAERAVLLDKQQPTMFSHQLTGPTDVIPLKPICIEQEAVTFSPQRITIEQPPLTVQPQPITIPQPPIVIHPEPIVIPQAPLFFQPGPVTLPRQALSFQPAQITLNRPSYSVQPFIQYDMRGCSKFNQADFKQHVHIKLTNDLMRQQFGSQWQGMQGQQLRSGQVSPMVQDQAAFAGSPRSMNRPASFFSRDRNY